MSREHPSLAQTLTRTASEQILTRPICRGIERHRRAIGEPAAFHMPPEMGHGIPCWRSDRQPPECDGPRRGPLPTRLCRMRRSTLFAPDDGPSAPLRPDHRQAVVRGVLLPRSCAHHRARAWPSVEGAVEHAPGPRPGQGEASLWPKPTGAPRSGWGGRHARLSQPHYHRTPAACQASFAPPVACRQVDARRARSSRGRCHARPRRARARPTRRREAWRGWTSRRSGRNKGAVHTVARLHPL
jgi:hypothetical protein